MSEPEGYELIQGTGSYAYTAHDKPARAKRKHPIGFALPKAKKGKSTKTTGKRPRKRLPKRTSGAQRTRARVTNSSKQGL